MWLYHYTMVYFLLNNKECESYAKCFNILKTECFKLNLCCSPEYIFVYFELSIHLGALKVWPTIIIKGCRFHLEVCKYGGVTFKIFGVE